MWWFLALSVSYVAGMGGLVTWATLSTQRRHLQAWRDAAVSCGLEVVEVSRVGIGTGRLKLAARAGAVEVLIQSSRDRKYRTLLVVKVPGPPGFTAVRLSRELYKPSPAREIEVGDEAFDKTFSIEGSARLVLALLGMEARRLLSDINAECQLAIGGGELRAATYEVDVPIILSLLLDLAHRFAHPDVVRRLSENALCDPQAGVRLRNLLLLARELPGDPRTIETLRAARADASPEIRLRAAVELGPEGRDVLIELAESDVDDAWSALALSFVGRELPLEHARAILLSALRRRRIETAGACLEALGHRGAAAVDVLAKVLAREKGGLATAAALALGTTGSTAAEPPLIPALQHERLDVRVAAANALARVGSAAAVLPL